MRPSLLLLSALLASCAREGVVASAAHVVVTPPVTPVEVPFERWSCARVRHPLADYHRATLDLRGDGSFELHHTHTTPERGWSTWIQGTYTRSDIEVVLTPVSALRRTWIGDAHRAQHGENVHYRASEEAMTRAPWHLALSGEEGARALRIEEVRTHVFLAPIDVIPPPCDDGEPPLGML